MRCPRSFCEFHNGRKLRNVGLFPDLASGHDISDVVIVWDRFNRTIEIAEVFVGNRSKARPNVVDDCRCPPVVSYAARDIGVRPSAALSLAGNDETNFPGNDVGSLQSQKRLFEKISLALGFAGGIQGRHGCLSASLTITRDNSTVAPAAFAPRLAALAAQMAAPNVKKRSTSPNPFNHSEVSVARATRHC